jgi:predicted DNA-binding ArsR family transcriptional regulator
MTDIVERLRKVPATAALTEEAANTIEQLRRKNEEAKRDADEYHQVAENHIHANEELRNQLAAQALVIEKLRDVLVKIEPVLKEEKRYVRAADVSRALAATTDYAKLLAERDAALLERVADRFKGGFMSVNDMTAKQIRELAAKIRAGEEV